jgi:hypothetical protein
VDSLRFEPLFHVSIKLTNQTHPFASSLVDFLRESKPFKGLDGSPDILVGVSRDGIIPNDRDHRIATEFVILPSYLHIEKESYYGKKDLLKKVENEPMSYVIGHVASFDFEPLTTKTIKLF